LILTAMVGTELIKT